MPDSRQISIIKNPMLALFPAHAASLRYRLSGVGGLQFLDPAFERRSRLAIIARIYYAIKTHSDERLTACSHMWSTGE